MLRNPKSCTIDYSTSLGVCHHYKKKHSTHNQSCIPLIIPYNLPINLGNTKMEQILIKRLIAEIDEKINSQVNLILHHSAFQRLEATWRGIAMVINTAQGDKTIQVKIFNMSAKALAKDLEHAVDFDQSTLFKKIYNEEYDQPGGLPFGLLVGDYYFSHKPTKDMPDGLSILTELAKIGAAAFCPIVTAIAPAFFGIDRFSEIQVPFKIDDLIQQKEYIRWKKLRELEESRYLGCVLPRIRMRKPYNAHVARITNRFFKENLIEHDDYLWGNASYAYACVAIQSFKETGWFSDIRGMNPTLGNGGLVDAYRDYYVTDEHEVMAKSATEYAITDAQERIFSDAGFMALRDNRFIERSIFYSSQSLQNPKRYTTKVGTVNAKISSMLHYVLCASRFAHYIKVIVRDKVGSFMSPKECELFLEKWLHRYRAQNTDLTPEARAKYPLTQAKIKVKELPGLPGKFNCIMYLKPHYQIDDIESHLKLVTQVKLN